jgi:magnesium transporter
VFEKFFKIHALSLEDATRLRREPDAPPHLPKVEEFPDYLFVIVNPLTAPFLRYVGDPQGAAVDRVAPVTQLSAVLTHTILITHHYARLTCIDDVQDFLGRHAHQMERGPDYLFHLVLDGTVDEFAPVLDYLEDTLEGLETQIIHHPQQELYLRLLRIKREIILLRKTLIAEREVLVRLARGEFTLVDPRETVYYRNVYDHLVRFTELIETSREMASDLMQTYLSAQSNHLNQIMKVLTMISTIVLPMTLIAGIYGMNFDLFLPNEWGFFAALGAMVLSAGVSMAYFYWRRWL